MANKIMQSISEERASSKESGSPDESFASYINSLLDKTRQR